MNRWKIPAFSFLLGKERVDLCSQLPNFSWDAQRPSIYLTSPRVQTGPAPSTSPRRDRSHRAWASRCLPLLSTQWADKKPKLSVSPWGGKELLEAPEPLAGLICWSLVLYVASPWRLGEVPALSNAQTPTQRVKENEEKDILNQSNLKNKAILQKPNLIKEITQCIFSYHKAIKSEINSRKVALKFPNIWKLNNTFLNNTTNKENVSREIFKNTLNLMNIKYNLSNFVRWVESSA